MRKAVSLRPRLAAAFDMLGKADTVWDVGCDHGYLSAALLLSGRAGGVAASDISPASADKTQRLAKELGLEGRMTVFRADGLSGFAPQGEFKLALCGMGGELIAQILESGAEIAAAASLIVMQPMRGEEELRRYLYRSGFSIVDEAAVLDDGRYYQLIAAVPRGGSVIPDWFPRDYFRFGWVMCSKPDDTLIALLAKYRGVYQKKLDSALKSGRAPAKLEKELAAVGAIIAHIEAEGDRPC